MNGTLLWRPVRRTLDIGAFGINAYVAPNAGDDVVEEHTEEALGHEEVYVVLAGRATFTLDDETLDAPAGTSSSSATRRSSATRVAEEPETAVLAVGGPREAAYEPSPWEDFFAAERHRTAGDYDAYRGGARGRSRAPPRPPGDALQRSRAPRRWPGDPTTRSRTCGVRSSSGPSGRTWRATDDDLAALRERPGLAARTTDERQDGVTRYASKTASRLRRAVRSERSSFTSPTSAVYQFRAIPSSTTPP